MSGPRTPEGRAGAGESVSRQLDCAQDTAADSLSTSAVMQLWRQAIATSKRDSLARRARVLKHPDLAQLLTDPPLRLSSPERWSGWIPPKRLAEDACPGCERGARRCSGQHRSRVNDSPVRRQVVRIAAEAMARETGSEVPS